MTQSEQETFELWRAAKENKARAKREKEILLAQAQAKATEEQNYATAEKGYAAELGFTT